MLLSVRQLTKSFPTPEEPLTVLRGIDLDLDQGQALAIMGPSGAGKSTLLYVLGTLDRPTSGTVRFAQRDPFSLPEPELAAFRNLQVGFVFQDHWLLPQCTVLENVLLPTLVTGCGNAHREQARILLDRVGLGHRLNHRPAELSGGERQRVAVARALVNQPSLVLADEPTGNLDSTNAAAVGDLLLELCQAHQAALIVVTHSHDLAARFPLRRYLRDGQFISET